MLGTRPVIGVLLGDPTGIGPELVAKLVADRDLWDLAQTVIIGDQRIFAMGQKIAQTDSDVPIFSTYEDICFPLEQPVLLDLPTIDPAELELAKVDTRAGKSVYDTLLYTIDLAKQGKIDGFVFAPFNKAALHACGCPFETELDLFKNEFNRPEVRGELNVVEDAWNARVTSHVALKDVTSLITVQSVYETISFVNQVLKVYGKEVPKLAVSGLNPHCGEDGLFGTEEGDVIAPAIEKAREEGIDVSGPFPCDTIWLKVLAGEYDAVVSMYHDQGQIALKLLGFDKGVTVHGGLPVPIATPAHGTAFDIAGQGKANAQGIKRAFTIAGRMAANQKSNS
jgi:4-hydroxythreonine-4-phosphate dehydrogenase